MAIEARSTEAQLKDGTNVVIRPMTRDDVERSFAFFQSLPEEDRRYLRMDVTKRENVERRIRTMGTDHVKRLVAVVDDDIVADGALELSREEWTAHTGEIRLIVSRQYQRKGLGMLLARELYLLALREKLENIVVRMARPQVAARSIFHKLGFEEEYSLPDHVIDRAGGRHDLVLMRCDVAEMWRELETVFQQFGGQRAG
jgi:L-amino acid N-acyltransferase YncA